MGLKCIKQDKVVFFYSFNKPDWLTDKNSNYDLVPVTMQTLVIIEGIINIEDKSSQNNHIQSQLTLRYVYNSMF